MNTFNFKKFSINQQNSAMKIGTDGVLLGSWCTVTDVHNALDIGTGTGLLSLMIAQRNPSIDIDAVEIDPLAATEATQNINASIFKENIKVFCCSIQDFTSSIING